MASHAQLEKLVDFLERNPGIAKGLLRTSAGKAETKKTWQEISRTLNSDEEFKKDGVGWLNYWKEKKYELKRICARNNFLRNSSGRCPANSSVQLTNIDERMLCLLGWQSLGTGESGTAFNSFLATEVTGGFPSNILEQNMSASPTLSDPDTVVFVDAISERYPSRRVKRELTAANIGHTSSTSQSETNAVTDRSPVRRAPSPSSSHSQGRRQARGPTHSGDAQMHRMADIEARRVNAKVISGALESIARSLERVAAAITNLSNTTSLI